MTVPAELHPEILTPEGLEILRLHAPVADAEGFHLAGGTALALQLGHRRSVDFDWFKEAFGDPLSLARALADRGVPVSASSSARGTLHGRVRGLRVSFLEFRYPLLDPPRARPELGGKLAGLRDIGAMKLSAVAQRGARKDFHDVVALGRAGLGLEPLLAAYQRRFGVRDVGHVLTALTYFEDAERDPEPILEAREDWAQVKETLRGWVRGYAGRSVASG
jgi:hypothetical protein